MVDRERRFIMKTIYIYRLSHKGVGMINIIESIVRIIFPVILMVASHKFKMQKDHLFQILLGISSGWFLVEAVRHIKKLRDNNANIIYIP